MTAPDFVYAIPTRLLFGPGALDRLGGETLPGKKALLVMTGGKSAKATGAYDRLLAQLAKAGAAVVAFPKVQANPLRPTVMEGAALAKVEACDFVVALGGGSVMDAAKMIAVMARNPGDLWDYAFTSTGGNKRYPNAPLPIVCVSTTAGTGSEIDDGAVISDDDRREKPGFMDPRQFPVLSVVDPTLMVSVPPHLTAYQGFDALFHCVEGYLAGPRTLMSELYALAGVERIGANLARCVTHGDDLEARTQMALANTLGGFVMATGPLTSEHAIEHALSAFHHALPHGAGLIMVSLAYYKALIAKGACPGRFVRLAQALGRPTATRPEDFLDALAALQRACGVDALRMSDYGIVPKEFPAMAKNARDTLGGLFACDPAPLSDDDVVAIYQASFR